MCSTKTGYCCGAGGRWHDVASRFFLAQRVKTVLTCDPVPRVLVSYFKYQLSSSEFGRLIPCVLGILTVSLGHVDAGKSTLMGHLLFKLGQVSKKIMHKYLARLSCGLSCSNEVCVCVCLASLKNTCALLHTSSAYSYLALCCDVLAVHFIVLLLALYCCWLCVLVILLHVHCALIESDVSARFLDCMYLS